MKGWHYIHEDLILLEMFAAEWLAAEAGDLLAKHAEFLRRHGV